MSLSPINCVAVILSWAGNYFVIKKDWKGFFCWMVANAIWIVVDFQAGIYEQAFMYLVYFVIAVIGTAAWLREKPEEAKRLRNWVIGVSIALFVLATLPLVLPIVLIYVFVQYMIWELCSQPRQTLQSNVERDYPKGRL